jgi:predicted sugar kinase
MATVLPPPQRSGRLRAVRDTALAPVDLVGLCVKASTWRAISGAAEMLAEQWRGGLVVETSHVLALDSRESPGGPPAPSLTLRTLIQLDGDVVVTVDRRQIELAETRAQDQLAQAIASHGQAIALALQPLQEGLLTTASLLILARRSRWSVLGIGGLGQGGAIALAPGFSAADPIQVWLAAAAAHPWFVIMQVLTIGGVILSFMIRMLLRSLIRGRLNQRLPALLDRLTRAEVAEGERRVPGA